MILKIIKVADQSDKTKQRLILEVTEDGNLTDYAVVDNTYKDGIPSNLERHFYSFSNHPVKKGDIIWLHSTTGTNGPHNNKEKTIIYNFYWGTDISIWNVKDKAHILKIIASSDEL